MRVIVTEIPKTVKNCLFSRETENGDYTCILDKDRKCNYPYSLCNKLEKDARYR